MEQKEIRYYLIGKKSWNDVTVAITRKDMPKQGQVINVGKIKMVVKDIKKGISNGRQVTKIFLENTGELYTPLDEAIELLDNPTFLEIKEDINEAKKLAVGNFPGNTRIQYDATAGFKYNTQAPPAVGPGSPGTLGNAVRSQLSSLGAGYGAQVADFGEAVTVTITYSNAKSGRCASQSFVIIYRGPSAKLTYSVYANAGRYRHCNDFNQAVSFIRSKAGTLPGSTNAI